MDSLLTCLCGAKFKLLNSLNKHQKSECSLLKKPVVDLKCPHCGCKFTSLRNLNRHRNVNCSPSISNSNRKFYSCTFKDCQLQFTKINCLTDHVEYFHHVEIITEKLRFDSYDQFRMWKQSEEQLTFSYFYKQHSAPASRTFPNQKNKREIIENYHCQFNGKPYSEKKPKKGSETMPVPKPVRLPNICYSHIIAKVQKDGSVKVKYVPTHNHSLVTDSEEFQPIPQKLKYEILQLHSINMPTTEIHRRITKSHISRENRSNTKKGRESLIKLQDVQYLLSTESLDLNEITSHLVNSWSQETYNPVLIYKPHDNAICIGPYVNLPQESFLFGFQTKEQRAKLIKSKRMLYLGFLNNENLNVWLLTIVIEENQKEYPVAHFIGSNMDDETLAACFTCLKLKMPSYVPKTIMTSDLRLVNIFKMVFENETITGLLCHSHVLNEWSRKLHETISNMSQYEPIMCDLKLILSEKTKKHLDTLLKFFCDIYQPIIPVFTSYFKDNYMSPDSIPFWSLSARTFTNINTLQLVDNFHKQLQERYLKKLKEHDLYKLLICLAEIEKDYYANKIVQKQIPQVTAIKDRIEKELETQKTKISRIQTHISKVKAIAETEKVPQSVLDHLEESLEKLVRECDEIKKNEEKKVQVLFHSNQVQVPKKKIHVVKSDAKLRVPFSKDHDYNCQPAEKLVIDGEFEMIFE